MSWNAGRVSEHDPGEDTTRLACSRDCLQVPSDALHVGGQIIWCFVALNAMD